MTMLHTGSEEATASPADETAVLPVVPSLESAPTRTRRLAASWSVGTVAVTVLGALLLGFVADVTVLGGLRHDHDQRIAFQRLRADLANAVAPVGALDSSGHLYPAGTPVAKLDVPAIGLDEVVEEGTTAQTLISGPGHRRDTVLPGQIGTSVIMGRHTGFGGPFGKLSKLKVGDLITAVTGQGTHTYKVVGFRSDAYPPKPLAAGAGRLTLVTASDTSALVPNGTLSVDADLVSPAQPAPPRALAIGGIPSTEKALAGDASAWVRLVFWLQGLLLAAVAFAVARHRWGKWHAWIAGAPLILFVCVEAGNQAAQLLPNLT